MNKFNYRLDAAPNFKAKIIRHIVYASLVFLATFSVVYFTHYMGGLLNVDVDQPLREIPTQVVLMGLAGIFVTFVIVYVVVLWVARTIFVKLKV
ncbi:hypothetical protein BCU84_20280 [Shewanella sp. 10N.286.51.B7]|uniref:Uncharacterized protein n=1 Tax=Shewanella electrodiphila TaxID=934143 RepID=A0ABT0KVK4_9GAMM|nr:hypothetical protein [Shewanella electrodiphila]MCL1047824.1 hypothetical protein [Shewanella electrodiphila]PMG71016.1 hypothetical protein BCU84_20280 [Shewanella sp. 10N.286.51.B7]